jgi:hypothetical protein
MAANIRSVNVQTIMKPDSYNVQYEYLNEN